jgi:ABC transporter DrrB family efflux protein
MARSAVLVGRTLADAARNLVVLALMLAVGFAVGFRPHGSPAGFALAIALVFGFGYALSWASALVGLVSPSAEAAQAAMFPVLFPLTFASSAFVPVASMPSWLQGFATWQPVSTMVDAVRALVLGDVLGRSDIGTEQLVGLAVAVTVAIVAVCGPLAARVYGRTS